jgi:hypothetical protein
LIGIFSLSIEKGTIMMNNSIDEVFKYLIPIFGLVFIPLAFILFKRRLPSIQAEEDQGLKQQLYRGIFIQRVAFIEGVSIFSSIAFILTLNPLYVAYTLFALTFYLPFYPTKNRINNDIGILNNSVNEISTNENHKSFFGKNPWAIVLLTIVMISLNYSSFKDLLSNKTVLPNIQVDKGTITDSIYHNNYLNWTFIIPKGYHEIPLEELKKYEKKGEKILNTKIEDSKEVVKLLNISNGVIDFTSNLYPRALYPNLTNEDEYLKQLNEVYQNVNIESLNIEKQGQGIIEIDSLEFHYVEYLITGQSQVGLLYLTRFNKDFILDFSISYQETQQAIKFLKRLKTSQIKWK